MDNVPDRAISRIFNSVVDSTALYTTACPPREAWSWRTIWNKFNKSDVKNVEKDTEATDNKNKELQISEELYNIPEKEHQVCDIETLCRSPDCVIKMQDPCEICCCTECKADEESPCEGVPQGPRDPICECDPKNKFKKDHDCCDACEHHGFKRV